jgi:uncharacterized protein (TIGR02145 family)
MRKLIKPFLLVLFIALFHGFGKGQTVVDYDGNVYDTVVIGSQVWLKENLKTTHYNNGIPIPNVTDMGTWGSLTTGARCYYDNDSVGYDSVYGSLYNFYAVKDASGLCPEGWHVPADAEWTALENFLGGSGIAGGKMKESGTLHWLPPNAGATNSSGFTGLPGGMRTQANIFQTIGENGLWWSSTAYGSLAWSRYLWYMNAGVDRNPTPKTLGLSIRCMKDVSVGVESYGQTGKFRIYPNPSKGRFIIENADDQLITLTVRSLNGEQIMVRMVTGKSNEIDISSFAKGTYFLTVSGNNWSITQKLVKE